MTLNADGSVATSGTTAASMNGAFTDDFADYLIRYYGTFVNGASGRQLRLRAAGVDAATQYDRQSLYGIASVTSTQVFNVAQWDLPRAGGGYMYAEESIELWSPARSEMSRYRSQGFSGDGAASNVAVAILAGNHRAASPFDGLSFLTASGESGRYRVFGYA